MPFKNYEQKLAYNRVYNKNHPGWHKNWENNHPSYYKDYGKNYYLKERNKLKRDVRFILNNNIKSGKIVRPLICSKCKKISKSKIEGHHRDYNKPLDVVWLCKSCHVKEHLKFIKFS